MVSKPTKNLRSNQTEAEKQLWKVLRAKRFQHLKFRRQVEIGPYIVDFVCHGKNVIIEVDGGQHASQQGADEIRTQFLESEGYRVLRFWNNEVQEDLDGVLEIISKDLK